MSDSSSPDANRPGLLVVHVGPTDSVYRTEQPCRALGELPEVAVVSASTQTPALFDSGLLLTADVLIVRDVGDPDLLAVFNKRRRLGRLSVYEIGEHLFPSPDGEPAGRTEAPDLVQRSLKPLLARQADCLQFATPALDARFAGLNSRRAVFPSQMWDAPPPLPLRRLDRVVIGWGGGTAERDDFRSALPALAGVLERHPEVAIAVMGDPGVRQVLETLPADRVSFSPWESLEGYYGFLHGIDIGLAPLVPTAANRCRGDIRFVEYAAHGVLAVCVELEPYKDVVVPGQTGYLYRDVTELETVLERALAEGEVRAAIPARAARYVAAERLERRHAAGRLGFYLSAAAQVGMKLGSHLAEAPKGRPIFPPPELLEPRAHARTFEGSRYLALGKGEVEALLTEGLAHQRAGAIDQARRCFTSAGRLAPRSHLPALLLGAVAPPAAGVEALARAEAMAPHSCQAAYLRGVRLLELGDQRDAALAFERARAIAPSFGAPAERLGFLAEEAGRLEEACLLYEEAALQNSAFALPIARLATIAQKGGRIDKAVGLLERSLTDDPDLSLTNFLVGRAYLELRRFHQARLHLRRAVGGAQGDDRAAILTDLAKAEAGLGNADAARDTLEELGRPI